MDKNTDFSTYFAELCEQTELTEQGQMLAADKNDKYLELGDTHIFTDGWERYRTMYDGVWDSDAERFINRDVKGACVLLENLYKRLQPLEADIIINYEKISWWPNDKIWMQDAYNICKEYHRQKAVMTLMEPQQEQQKRKHKVSPGRPSKFISEFILYADKEKLLNRMHSLIDGKKGKEAVLIIFASVVAGYMTRPTHGSVEKEFGRLCATSYYNKIMQNNVNRTKDGNLVFYQNKSKITNQEIESIIENLAL